MELLRFDSRRPAGKYGFLVEMLRSKLAEVSVISPIAVPVTQPAFGVLGSIPAFQPALLATR
jgi:hypothetical protein